MNTETDSERYGGIIANVASELFRFSDTKRDTLSKISDTLNVGIERQLQYLTVIINQSFWLVTF